MDGKGASAIRGLLVLHVDPDETGRNARLIEGDAPRERPSHGFKVQLHEGASDQRGRPARTAEWRRGAVAAACSFLVLALQVIFYADHPVKR